MVYFASLSLALAALASCAAASIVEKAWTGPCGTNASANKAPQLRARQTATQNSTNSTVLPLYLHVILADGNTTTDFITDELLDRQVAILNEGFTSMPYTFALAGTTRTTNASWFYNATQLSQRETDMKAALRRGDKTALNVYIVGLWDSSISAWSTLPLELAYNIPNDGIVLHNSVLLGGASTVWTLGKTLIHEAGHWVGLYHTFAGGCGFNGDYVADTPLEDWPAASWDALGGCPEGRDSCPDAEGVDPIHNYMDYTGDECRTEFTAGQVAYAREQMGEFRGV